MAQAALALAFDDTDSPASGAQAPRGVPAIQGDDPTGFELGWDHAQHGLVPPTEYLLPANPLRQGWEAGRAVFGQRLPRSSRHVRKWLQLRLHAWRRGRHFETHQVTPHYLAQIDTERCPVSRVALTRATGLDTDASVDRVFNDAGYAAGNLAVLSTRVNTAKASLRWDEARLMAVMAETRTHGPQAGTVDGLGAPEWARLAVLMSFVTALPHEVAASLPLLVLPPNRLRLLNPIQGLQTLITRLLLAPGYVERSERLAALLPSGEARRDFRLVFLSLLPHAWDRSRGAAGTLLAERRERLEDAWRCPVLLRRWQRLARHLDAAQAEAIVEQAMRQNLGGGESRLTVHSQAVATEGWALETRGYAVSTPGAQAQVVPLLRAHRVPRPAAAA